MRSSRLVNALNFIPAVALAIVSGFFLGSIGRSASLYHLAVTPWDWSVSRDLRLYAIENLALAVAFVLGAAYVMDKVTSSRTRKVAAIAAAVIVGWLQQY